jgi:competence protein ComEC
MAVIHFLNVNQGDCSWIKHNDGKITVLDVCNAYKETAYNSNITSLGLLAGLSKMDKKDEPATVGLQGLSRIYSPKNSIGLWNSLGDLAYKDVNSFGMLGLSAIQTRTALLEKPRKNFNQKAEPENPIRYLKKHGVYKVFRFILTHPDMDHMDGIRDFFEEFQPDNFWDIDNEKEIDVFKNQQAKDDWIFYGKLRDKKIERVRRLTLYDGAEGKYYNEDEYGNSGGHGLYILAPSNELVREAKELDDYNDCSYVILYVTGNKKILFCGDSHDKTWEYILRKYKNDVENIDLLIAPHHGRDSNRSYDFLNILKPKLTFFGNANSEHLAYGSWNQRRLEKITNNEGNCLIAKIDDTSMDIFVTHYSFANEYTSNNTYFDNEVLGWYIKTI